MKFRARGSRLPSLYALVYARLLASHGLMPERMLSPYADPGCGLFDAESDSTMPYGLTHIRLSGILLPECIHNDEIKYERDEVAETCGRGPIPSPPLAWTRSEQPSADFKACEKFDITTT